MLNAAICDDEKYFLDSLSEDIKDIFRGYDAEICVAEFSDSASLLASKKDFDIIFLDINMKSPDGLETARILRSRGYGGYLVFITALRDSVFDAFEPRAFDYIVKPIDKKRLQITLERLLRSIRANEERLFIRTKDNSRIILFSDIIYCEVINRKVSLHMKNGETFTYYDKIEALESRLDRRFFKCHRSFLVNLSFVRGSSGGMICVSNGEKIPLSRLKAEEFAKAMMEFMGRDGL